MPSLLDAVIALERQGCFAEALHTIQALLANDLPRIDQATLALFAGQCGLKLGGEQGYRTGRVYLDRARELYEQLAQPEMVAVVIATEAIGAVQCGVAHALQTALQKLDEAEIYQQEAHGQAAATIAHYRAVVYDRLGEKAHAFEYFTRAYELLQHNPEQAANVLDDLGAYYVSLGKPHLARSCYTQAIAKKTAIGDVCGQAVTYGHLGRLLEASEQYPEAIERLCKAIDMGIQTDNIREVAHNHSSLAQAYMALEDYDKATQALEMCIRLASQHSFSDLLAHAYVGQARLLRQQGHLTQALTVLRVHAIPMFRTSLDAPGLAAALQHEGGLLHAMGQWSEAIEAFQEASYLYRDSLCARELVMVTLELSKLYLDSGRVEDARTVVRTALDLAEKLGDTHLVRSSDVLLERLDPTEAVQRAFRRVDGHDMESRSFLLGGQREFLTVLMSDIVNFTAYATDTELQEVTQTLNDYFTLMTDAVVRHHGHVDKYVGDGLMAIFREGPGVGHHANRAVYAAIEMLERLRDFNKERAVHHQQALHIRIGVHSGPAILGNIGCYGKMDYTAIGPAVILASRLEQHAIVDSVCISDATYQLLGGYFHAVPGPTFVPKGFSKAQRVWQVLERQPLLAFPMEFVAPGAIVTPHPGIVAIALGPQLGPGLIGRQSWGAVRAPGMAATSTADATVMGSAAALVYTYPHLVLQHIDRDHLAKMTILLPRCPDIDAIVAAYFVQELFEQGRLPAEAQQVVEYVQRIQMGTLLPTSSVWHTPYGVMLGIRGRNLRYCREHALSQTQQDLYDVQRTFYFLHYLLERIAAGVDIVHPEAHGTPRLFDETEPLQPPFERERDFVRRDVAAYNRDMTRAYMCEVVLPVLELPGNLRPSTALTLEDPTSTLFATWAHQDTQHTATGFDVAVLCERKRHYCISVNPAAGICLQGLGSALERAEGAKRQRLDTGDFYAIPRAMSVWTPV
jgi:class 3 adenylate cyclase/Tfp pilus assembly protein PilF